MASFNGLVNKVENELRHLITVIIAAMNEEEGIGPTLMELREELEDPMCLVVDGNSVDKTIEIAKEMGANVLEQKGSGKGQALAQAVKHVDSARYVAFIDADFTYPAGYISRMIRILEENPEIGMVTGNRFNRTYGLSAIKSLYFVGNRFLAVTQRLLNGVHLKDPLTGLRVIRVDVIRGWEPKSKGFDIEAEMNHLVERKGYRTVEIPIYYRPRLGTKKLKLRHGFSILRRIVLESI